VVGVAFFSVSISLNFPFPRHAILKKVKLSSTNDERAGQLLLCRAAAATTTITSLRTALTPVTHRQACRVARNLWQKTA